MTRASTLRASSPLVLAIFGVLTALIVIACWPTFLQLAHTWSSDASYQHGWFVPPIAAYLVWRRRADLGALPVHPSWPAVVLLTGGAAIWLVALLTDLRIVAHFAAMSMIVLAAVAVFGHDFSRRIAFPLAYLLLAVPAGESLIPLLMQFTADFTVVALQWTGIPVYRSGLYFVTPSGIFEVSKSCSGIRYIMSSVAISALLAYVMFRSWRRRALLVVFAAAVAVFGNALRAYVVVLVAHFSDMKLAAGIDHFVYGWLMFFLLMLVVYWVASRFREAPERTSGAASAEAAPGRWFLHSPALPAVATVAASILVSVAAAAKSVQRASINAHVMPHDSAPRLPRAVGEWRGPELGGGWWRPAYAGATGSLDGRYTSGRLQVTVFAGTYAGGRVLSGDMVGSGRGVLAGEEAAVRLERRVVRLADGERHIAATLLGDRDLRTTRAVWLWYEVGDRVATSGSAVKLFEVLGFLRGRVDRQRVFVLSATSAGDDGNLAEQALRRFLEAHSTALRRCAARAPEASPHCVGET